MTAPVTLTAPSWAWIALAVTAGALTVYALSLLGALARLAYDHLRSWSRAWRRVQRVPRRIGHRFPLSHLRLRRAPKPTLYDQDAPVPLVEAAERFLRNEWHKGPKGAA